MTINFDFDPFGFLLAAILGFMSIYLAIRFGKPTLATWQDAETLKKSLANQGYTAEQLSDAARYYVPARVASRSPADFEEPIDVLELPTQSLFEKLDECIGSSHTRAPILLLADAGMGKTVSAINYFLRLRKRGIRVALVNLASADADKHISQIPLPHNRTVLILDSLDEDPHALRDLNGRIQSLSRTAESFKRVIITCRNQFFPHEASIPKLSKLGGAPSTGDKVARWTWLYLAPLNDQEVTIFGSSRISVGPRWRFRVAAAGSW